VRAGDGEDGPGQPDAAAIRVRGVMATVSTDDETMFADGHRTDFRLTGARGQV
jgi:hypothetical protein